MPGTMTAQTEMLEMTGIAKRFGPVQALADVSLRVRRGTVHALCGENGAGKSTLMKILAGVYRPDAGRIVMNGRECRFQNPGEAIAAGIAMIYQELDLAPDLTVAENVFLGAEPRSRFGLLNRSGAVAATAQLAAEYGFTVAPAVRVADLAIGDRQIVELLKALRKNASIIVMDEPTSSLSAPEVERLFAAIRTLRARGIAIVYISHRLEEVVGLADAISVLRDGRVVHSGPLAEVDIPGIIRHMVGRDLADFYPARAMRSGDEMVRVENLSARSGIRNITFSVRAGEIVGMAGLIGAGRTEVARAIFGLDPSATGRILLDGRELIIRSPADAIAAKFALLTEDRQGSGLCLELPCSWNISLPNLAALGMGQVINPTREERRVAEFAAKVKVKWPGPAAPVLALSGGNQQKLLLARWLLANSRFLIFDEPTRGIDVGAKQEIYALLNQLAREGRAMLLISSELNELLGVTDRILVMRRGEIAGELVTGQATAEQIMQLAAVA